ncbi:MAG: TonB-dependent receptor, partial [Bacteroidota bacterium]
EGKIKDEKGEYLPYVNITVTGTQIGTASDDNGSFLLSSVPAGNQTLVFSSLGLTTLEYPVIVNENETVTIQVTMVDGGFELQGVEIIGRRETGYDNKVSFAATKTATLVKDIPQAVSYVTKEVMEDRQAYRVNDVVKNISGINQFSYYNDYTIRGFRSQQELINGLRVIGLFGPQILVPNLERVEVIKGPASAMFGNSSPGGTMNRVTKKPLLEDRKAINFTTGSFNTLRTTLDFTGPLNDSKTLLYRLNLAYENSDSFRDIQEYKSFVVAPSISFLPTDKTRLNFDLVITRYDGKLDRGQPIFGASAGTDLNSTPISFAIGAANDYHETDVAFGTLSLSHQFTDNFSFNASYMRYAFQEDLFEHRTSNRFAVDGNGDQIPTLMGMRISAREQQRISDNLSAYFIWETQTGELEHKILAGYDYIQSERPIGGGGIFTSSGAIYRTVDGGLDTYDPADSGRFLLDGDGNPIPNIPHFNLEDPTYLLGFPSDYILGRNELIPEKFFTNGIYIQDQIKWKRLQVLLGLRQEYYTDVDNYKQSDEEEIKQDKLLPRIGVVYSVNDNVNVYGTYTESFQPQNPSDISVENGGPFDPLTGTMLEVGAKATFFDNRLSINVAAYTIENKNILINDIDTGLPTQRGGEESKGIEIDVNGQINDNLSITANYANNNATITESDDPTEIGRAKENAPVNSGGLFANYKFIDGDLDGLNFNVGTNFVSSRNTFERDLRLPEYNVWDLGFSYRVNKVRLALNINNVFDKTHWVGGYSYVRLFPGEPRNYLLTVGYTF